MRRRSTSGKAAAVAAAGAAATPGRQRPQTDTPAPLPPPRRSSLLRDELPAVVLLVVLYMLQGVPLGLSMGSM
jgi:hypothetical protein